MTYNTGETSEELKIKYNPEGSVLRTAQYRMLEMLIFLDQICKELQIDYSLEGGNVLGAVRHGGFIPWDDDVDVIMKRSDYNRFIKYMKSNPHPQFVLQTRKSDPGYYGTWVVLRDLKSEYLVDSLLHRIRKYRGLQIDIFPIQKGNLKILNFLSYHLMYRFNKHLLGKNRIIVGICSFILHDIIFLLFRKLSDLIGNRLYFSYEYGHVHFPKFKYSDVFPTSPITFEGKIFSGPNNPHGYLTSIYKNYNDLPPKDKRDHHHAKYIIQD